MTGTDRADNIRPWFRAGLAPLIVLAQRARLADLAAEGAGLMGPTGKSGARPTR